MQEILNTAETAARRAGAYILEAMRGLRRVDYKGRVDMVTDVDRGSEALILACIRRDWPQHAILAEESGASQAGSDWRWVIDPIDGTTNFVHGYPFFCVSIAVQQRLRTEVAVVYDPVHDEMFTAVRGGGAFLNGAPLQVSRADDLSRTLLATGFPYELGDRWHRSMDYFKLFYYRTHGVRRDGAAALDLCYVAAGRFDGFWEFDLKPWDVAAGLLLVTEAGGRVTDFAGRPAAIDGRQLVASNGAIHDAMLDVLRALPSDPP
ncbi:inositol monophosphatase family protein [Syntrophotalea acetylenica]|uniref:inositol monophosphatase family protein n=1 Tax=Syntrophotalea acetylenica TaxID=29542 RepID=UPI002A35F6DF|nr:inositol monophosphatase family protein [Syntrophotalea acetylenica]MDY0261438.1 inositol monophosphatase family protein [Syntrophotalea acetylenica]